jgi:hypothetical protein
MHERGRSVDASERTPENRAHTRPSCNGAVGLGSVVPGEGAHRHHRSQARRPVEASGSGRFEGRFDLDIEWTRARSPRRAGEKRGGASRSEESCGRQSRRARDDDLSRAGLERRPVVRLGNHEHGIHPAEAERVR